MGFSRQEYLSGLPFPPPGDFPDPGIESASLTSPALAGRFFTTGATWGAHPLRFPHPPPTFMNLQPPSLAFPHPQLTPPPPAPALATPYPKQSQPSLPLKVKSLSRVRLCDPVDCSLPGSSVHGIFQARVLEWVAISFSRGSSRPRDRTQFSLIVGRRFTV